MTVQEIAALVRLNVTTYNPKKEYTPDEFQGVVSVWAYNFGSFPAQVVQEAFMRATGASKYMLTPADVMEQLEAMAAREAPSTEELWQTLKAAVDKAARLMYYRDKPLIVGVDENGWPIKDDGRGKMMRLWEQLPAQVRGYLGSVSGLEDLTRCSLEDLDTYRRAEWRKYCEGHKPDPVQVLAGGHDILQGPGTIPRLKRVAE